MKYAIFSDIHGNYDALCAVIEDMHDEKIDAYICLGDIVGYGAEPRECIRKVQELEPIIIAGNHDYAVSGRFSIDYFNPLAKEPVIWSRTILDEKELAFLDELPLIVRTGNMTLCHSTVHAPELFGYIMSAWEAVLSFRAMTTPTAFLGHSHVPVNLFNTDPFTHNTDQVQELDPEVRTIINVGSVGQPRDEDPRAAYCLYDSITNIVRIKRVHYDIEAAAAKILKAGFPRPLAERLFLGT